MGERVEDRLRAVGVTVPEAVAPVANYVPWVRTGDLVFVSGQLPLVDGALAGGGLLGRDLTADRGRLLARTCAVNLIAQLRVACDGDLDRVVRVVRLGGFVACTSDFTEHPQVINGASDLMVEAFGEAGRHARAAVGCAALPLGAPVEVDGVFEVR